MPTYICEGCGSFTKKGYRLYKTGRHVYCQTCRMKRARQVNKAARRRRPKTKHIKKKLVKENGRVCSECGNEGRVEAHHIKPLWKGGEDTRENVRLLCDSCHKKKHSTGNWLSELVRGR